MVIDSFFDVGDTVWVMMENKPTECEVTGLEFNSGVIGCDGRTRSILNESFYIDTTVKYYIVRKSKIVNGSYSRNQVESYPFYKRDLFASKELCVKSLL